LIAGASIVHLLFLHQTGRRNPLGLNRNFDKISDKISFHPYFSLKDLFGFFVILFIFSGICFFYPWILGDPENFLPANPLVTPVHIQPE
jgi:ubiquinol-cytochrome c reductase cytochrome b subunit